MFKQASPRNVAGQQRRKPRHLTALLFYVWVGALSTALEPNHYAFHHYTLLHLGSLSRRI